MNQTVTLGGNIPWLPITFQTTREHFVGHPLPSPAVLSLTNHWQRWPHRHLAFTPPSLCPRASLCQDRPYFPSSQGSSSAHPCLQAGCRVSSGLRQTLGLPRQSPAHPGFHIVSSQTGGSQKWGSQLIHVWSHSSQLGPKK